MKLVYVAGPYTAPEGHNHRGYHTTDRYIGVAREASAWLAENGIGYYCPHLNSAHFEVITPDVKPAFWYEMDFLILEHCDAMLVLPGYQESKGTLEEIRFCRDHHIPTFFFNEGKSDGLLEWVSGEEMRYQE